MSHLYTAYTGIMESLEISLLCHMLDINDVTTL